MNAFLKLFLSMSCSGGLLILALLLGKRLLKDKISRQWQYYIWLVVVLRLLLPFGPEVSLFGRAYQAVDQAITQAAPLPQQSAQNAPGDAPAPAVDWEKNKEAVNHPAENLTVPPLQGLGALLTDYIWLLWLTAALALLIRKVTIYQGFLRYLHAGLTPVADVELLNRLSIAAEQAGVKKPIELCINPLISSPLLIGFFRPCIVLPSADISETDFQHIALHELTHYKRRDMFYKWLVQITLCLHWFNPLVHLMSREITRACEFSCDEAVLAKLGRGSAQDYGKTLLDAMAAVGKYKETLGVVPLSENKRLLKERIGAIMKFQKKTAAVRLLTGVLTLCVILGAAFVGVYPVAAASGRAADKPLLLSGWAKYPVRGEPDPADGEYASQAEAYYEAGSLPLFELAFSRLAEPAQRAWLEKLYAEGDFAFFSTAVRGLGANSPLLAQFAEKAYTEEEMAFFSTLTDCMGKAELELWLDRALEDGNWAFQSMLFDKLDRDGEFDELEEQRERDWAEAQAAEYRAAGVTVDGKNYYYQGQLVNIFLDIRANQSFYTLNMNPAGSVHIKISRDADDKIAGVAYMSEEEVTQLLEDMGDDDDWDGDDWEEPVGGSAWRPQVIPVNLETVAEGEIVWLGEYTLSEGDRIWYDVLAETGNGLQVGFAKSGDVQLNTVYYSAENVRVEGEALVCTAGFTFQPPAAPGTYRLFLRATDGALGAVTGSISISAAADAG